MKKLFLSAALTLMMGSAAFAQTPPEVLKPYKSFKAAMKAGDEVKARKFAYQAWQKSEEVSGDSQLTGDLAINYAMMKAPVTKANTKLRESAFERSIALAPQYGADTGIIYLERMSELTLFQQKSGKYSSAFETAKATAKYAEENNLTQSTFYPEALTHQATYYARKGKNKLVEKYATQALTAFENTNDGIQTVQPIIANLYKGYGLEAQKKTVDAVLSYQKVMEALDGVQPNEHPLAAKALGRWAHMRRVITDQGKLEEAEAQGLCRCWPYDKERNESLKPVKRVPPKIPQKALESGVSGFSIVEFDLDDAGKPKDTEILVSWPENLYDKESLKTVAKWQYTARTPDESDADRQDLIVTIRYNISNSNGDLVF